MKIILKKMNSIKPLKNNYLLAFSVRLIIILSIFSGLKSCIVPYFPGPVEKEEMLVVEGLISDLHEVNTIKLSKSIPLWKTQIQKPVTGCEVWISDDLGQINNLKETFFGTYITDSASFRGTIGRKYTLHISTNAAFGNLNYESSPMEMKPVPPIDSIYYEKKDYLIYQTPVEGCLIYLDAFDPTGKCNFYRWKYSETWEFRLPYNVTNNICWRTEEINNIFIKNTSLFSEARVIRYPITSITNPVDKLSVKYSIMVKQYSLNEDEYLYWERLKNTLDQVGGLYDLVPAFIPNNIYCIENPNEKILGYFSVSAVSSRRLFIKDNFIGWNTKYADCISDTIYGTKPIDGLNSSVWIIIDNSDKDPPSRIITYRRGCADCTERGTNIKPAFWDDDKK
jgi:hypothetical protein